MPNLFVEDLAERFRVSEQTIRRWHREGRLPRPQRIGQRLFWPEAEFNQWLSTRVAAELHDAENATYLVKGGVEA